MRRILASLFVIVAVAGIGIFATGAYFTDTVSITDQTFKTGSADLKFGQCGEIGTDCSGTSATFDTMSVPSAVTELTGPDQVNSGCLVVENQGDYVLNLTAALDVTNYSNADMLAFFQVAAEQANSSCYPTSVLMGWQSAAAAEGAPPVAFGTLAPGGRLYLVLSNRWDSTGNQNYLQDGFITLTTQVDGKTN